MMRGSIWIPDWPVANVIMAGHARPEEPIAIYDNHIIALNGVAYQEGVREGMKRRQAQSLIPRLRLIHHDPASDVASFEQVVRVCEEHIAYFSVLEPGLVTFLARGPVASAGSMHKLSENLVGDIALRTGFEAHVGFGDGLLTSILAARQDVQVQDATCFLDAHPVSDILRAVFSAHSRRLIQAFILALENLGVRRIGDLRQLDRHALVTRFGDTGKQVLSLIDGSEPEGEASSYDLRELVVHRDIDTPLNSLSEAAFLARAMAAELANELEKRGVIARELTIFTRTQGQERQRVWALDVASARDISERVRWQLTAWMAEDGGGPDSGITHISVHASAIVPAGHAQGRLWGADRSSRDAATRAISRIQSLLGDTAVVVPEHVGGRHPLEAHQMRVWGSAVPDTAQCSDPWPGALPEPWPNKVKAIPEKVSVLDARGHDCELSALGVFYCESGCTDSRPALLSWGSRQVGLTSVAGPWLQAVGWWNPHTQQRKAWIEAADDQARAYLAYREDHQWWLAGIYE
ncbi:DNA polymerase IV [Trueperella pyogenes]|uniref:DNA polymerase Y family protein n=1 Tax=Trueperella pyogenes TaxID=1661 RepID=UPI000DFB5A56|nr:DNA polymerase Y family protein [Trueperella pyogenes]MBB3024589.1 protein ImuB [Trueperella pyogenes]SUO87250.1 DNA polymerase IV [Trueperella pyogenes]